MLEKSKSECQHSENETELPEKKISILARPIKIAHTPPNYMAWSHHHCPAKYASHVNVCVWVCVCVCVCIVNKLNDRTGSSQRWRTSVHREWNYLICLASALSAAPVTCVRARVITIKVHCAIFFSPPFFLVNVTIRCVANREDGDHDGQKGDTWCFLILCYLLLSSCLWLSQSRWLDYSRQGPSTVRRPARCVTGAVRHVVAPSTASITINNSTTTTTPSRR